MASSPRVPPAPRVRLQRFLAQCGVASRRAAEMLIAEGHVRVNGAIVQQQGVTIDPETDRIELDGRVLRAEPKHYIAAYKPRGCLCTTHDPEGRPTLLDILRKTPRFPKSRLFTVGRLDYTSEGLILLTNDGAWAQRIAHPRYEIRKTYRVWLSKVLTPSEIARLRQGIVAGDGETLKLISIRPMRVAGEGLFYEIVLVEGHNRHIRRMFEALDISVRRLLRIRIGKLELGSLRTGRWRSLMPHEVRAMAAHPR